MVKLFEKFASRLDTWLLPKEIETHLKLAESHLTKGEIEDALREIKLADKKKPNQPKIVEILAKLHLEKSAFEEAIALLKKYTDLLTDPELLEWGIDYLIKANREEEAIELLKKVISLSPTDLRLHISLGELYLRQRRYDRIIRDFRKLLNTFPASDLSALRRILAQAYYETANYAMAGEQIQAILKDNPLQLDARLLEIKMDLVLGHHLEALSKISEAEKLFFENIELLKGKFEALWGLKDFGNGYQVGLSILEKIPADPYYCHKLGQILLMAGNEAQAIVYLKLAIQGDPLNAAPYISLHDALLKIQQPEEAFATLQKALDHQPNQPDLLVRSGAALLEKKRFNEAEKVFKKLPGLNRPPQASYGLGLIAENSKRLYEAIDYYKEVLKLDATYKDAAARLETLYHQIYPQSGVEFENFYEILLYLNQLLTNRYVDPRYLRQISRIRDMYDEPLLIAIMGEFNSGKSTVINALIGEKIAPMGVTPTTSTINILKYSSQKGLRVIYQDGTIEEIDFANIEKFFELLNSSQYTKNYFQPALALENQPPIRIDQVHFIELLFPTEELQWVNIVDTPGLNSIIPEHTQITTDFIEKADVVLWLFSALQPGTDSEAAEIKEVLKQGKKILGVLNKIDTLSSADQTQVIHYIQKQFGETLAIDWVDIIPIAAKDALLAKSTGNQSLLEKSNFTALYQAIHQNFFLRNRRIKRTNCILRLLDLLKHLEAENQELKSSITLLTQGLGELLKILAENQKDFLYIHLESIETALADNLQKCLEQATREIIELGKPKELFFEKNRIRYEDQQLVKASLLKSVETVFMTQAEEIGHRVQKIKGAVRQFFETSPSHLLQLNSYRLVLEQWFELKSDLLWQGILAPALEKTRIMATYELEKFFMTQLPDMELSAPILNNYLNRLGLFDLTALMQLLNEWRHGFFEKIDEYLNQIGEEIKLFERELLQKLFEPVSRHMAIIERMIHPDRSEDPVTSRFTGGMGWRQEK